MTRHPTPPPPRWLAAAAKSTPSTRTASGDRLLATCSACADREERQAMARAAAPRLTPRRLQVLALAAEGLTIDQIAAAARTPDVLITDYDGHVVVDWPHGRGPVLVDPAVVESWAATVNDLRTQLATTTTTPARTPDEAP